MTNSFSSIWLELGKPRQKKILVCYLYREWQYLMQDTEDSSTIEAQYDRWISFLDQWEMAICSGREILVLGDVNLNFLTWTNNNSPMTSHTYKLRSLTAALFDRIIPYGFVQLINVATRLVAGCEPSGLDHVYSS